MDLVTLTDENLNGKLHFLCVVIVPIVENINIPIVFRIALYDFCLRFCGLFGIFEMKGFFKFEILVFTRGPTWIERRRVGRWGLDRVNISEFGEGMPHKKPIVRTIVRTDHTTKMNFESFKKRPRG